MGTRDQPRRMNALGYHVWMIRFYAPLVFRPAFYRCVRWYPVRRLHLRNFILARRLWRSPLRRKFLLMVSFWRGRYAARPIASAQHWWSRSFDRSVRLYRALEFLWLPLFSSLIVILGAGGHRARQRVLEPACSKAAPRAGRRPWQIRSSRARTKEQGTHDHSARRCPSVGFASLCGVNLNVEPGERRLIIGPNGAGKTTLFNLITWRAFARLRFSRSLVFGHDITQSCCAS